MSNPIQQKIDDVRRRVRRLLVAHGVSCVAAIVLAAAIGLSCVDYLFRFDDHGVRLIFSVTVLGTLAWTMYRFLWHDVRRRLSDLAIAQRVERQFPQLGDRLSTSVEFLKKPVDDAYAGSAALRRAVVTTTTADIEPLDFAAAIERRPTHKVLRIAGLLTLSALLLAASNPGAARVALARLVRPFGNDAWPRQTNLQIVGKAPTRLAVGQTFELNVTDRDGTLPDEARIHLRYDSPEGDTWGDVRVDSMQRLNDTLVARQENVSRPFWYRVTGGDDESMEWIRLEVVEPPRVESLKVRLQSPAYTAWPAVTSDRQIQALRGTRAELSASVNKRLSSARLMQEGGVSIAASVGGDGHTVKVPADPASPLIIDKSTAYWLEMIDDEGLAGGRQDRWEIRAIGDGAPSVAIEQPTANQFVTTDAEIAMRVLVKDDLAIRNVVLQFSRSAEAGVEDLQVPLFQGPESAAFVESQKSAVPQEGDSRTLEHTWRLASLNLKPGTQLTFCAVASDYLPQVGKSPERRITIITPRELEDRIAQRQTLILGELSRVLKLQQETRSQVSDLQIQLDKVGQLAKPSIDHAQGAELNQRIVSSTLTSADQGLPAQIGDLLGELKANKVDSPEIERRMNTMLDELGRLAQEHLGPIERELTSAIKTAQTDLAGDSAKLPHANPDSPVGKALTSAAVHQDQVIRSLETMLGELAQWDSYRRFGREISQLKLDQEELEEQTAEVGAKTLGKDRKSLDPQQQADLIKLAERQRELARRFDKVQQQMTEMAQSLEETDPLAAATLGDAARQAAQRGISGQIRAGGRKLDDNQIGQARKQQQQVLRELNELLDILSNRREQELSRLVKRLKEAESHLEQLRARQERLRKEIAEADKIADPQQRRKTLERLSREQKQLQEESERFARRLARLQADKAGRNTQSAASKMSKGGDAGQQGDGDEAGDQAEQAKKDLDEAQQQLAERRQQAEMDLAREQIAKLQGGLKSLGEQQQSLLAETERLESLRSAQGLFTRPQIISVRDLGRAERGLESESKALAEKVASAEVFHLALETIGGEMGRAADRIERQDTGEPAQRIERDVIRRIHQLLQALESARKQGGEGKSGGQGGQQNAAASDSIRALAEVKLLKLMQQDLNVRFQQLSESAKRFSRGEQAAEFDRLSAEQGKLADLMQNFTRPPANNPDGDPESLPDLRLEETP